MLDLNIPDLAASHSAFLSALRGTGEAALFDFARETLPDLVDAIGPDTEAKGMATITGDILKVVRPISPANEGSVLLNPNPVSYLVARRRRSGRVRDALKSRHNVRLADFLEYRDRKHRNVGLTAAGYLTAAKALGVSLPAWIAEHGDSEGSFSIEREGDRITISLSNEVPWAYYLPGAMSRSGYAVQVKSGRLYDLAVEAMARAAAQTTF
jgi:hypothetical protein